MSRKGVFGAVVFFVAFVVFVGAAIAFDVWLRDQGGDDATITFGVRWLTANAPWTVITAVGMVGFLLGFLTCHFWASPRLFNRSKP